jgi:hypothetical protein
LGWKKQIEAVVKLTVVLLSDDDIAGSSQLANKPGAHQHNCQAEKAEETESSCYGVEGVL